MAINRLHLVPFSSLQLQPSHDLSLRKRRHITRFMVTRDISLVSTNHGAAASAECRVPSHGTDVGTTRSSCRQPRSSPLKFVMSPSLIINISSRLYFSLFPPHSNFSFLLEFSLFSGISSTVTTFLFRTPNFPPYYRNQYSSCSDKLPETL